MADWFTARRIGEAVASAPGGGMRRWDLITALGYGDAGRGAELWRDGWGLAYARGLIDFVGDFVVAPARRDASKPVPKGEESPSCTQASVRAMLF